MLTTVRLLSDPLPLRRSSLYAAYVVERVLPWVYGRVSLAPVPLDGAGTRYLIADHPIGGVVAVTVGGVATAGWELLQTTDETGHAIALLRLSTGTSEAVAVTVLGRRHAATGALLEQPADILEDLLTQCGWSLAEADLDALREAWPTVALAGVIDEPMTLRAAIATVIETLGADWSASPLRAWDPADGSTPRATLSARALDGVEAQSTHEDLVTRLTVRYGHDWAAGAARAALRLEAPDAVADYGALEAVLDLPWVRTARDALAIGTTHLARRARPRWTLSGQVACGSGWRPGDLLDLQHPWLPAGPARVSRVSRTTQADGLTLTRAAGETPRIVLIGRGALVAADTTGPVSLVYRDGIATFTILDEQGNPLVGARVTLDGTETRTTDPNGQVQFTTTRGEHTLLIEAHGYASVEMVVTV